MPELRAILPLLLFGLLLLVLVLVVRRTSRLVAETRQLTAFQRRAAELEARLGEIVEPVLAHLDELRHHRVAPGHEGDPLARAATDLEALAADARALRAPRVLHDAPANLARELERAERAVGLAEHGRNGLETIRGGPREQEAQTSLKRASLNLRHSRLAVADLVSAIVATRPEAAVRADASALRRARLRDARAGERDGRGALRGSASPTEPSAPFVPVARASDPEGPLEPAGARWTSMPSPGDDPPNPSM